MPDEALAPDSELLYAEDDGGRLLLVPAEVADEIFHARESLPHCRTWGDARRELSGRYFGELVDEYIGLGEEPPADDRPLDPRSMVAAEDWPGIVYPDLSEGRPAEIASWFKAGRFGAIEALLAALDVEDVVASLRDGGIASREDPAILGLLNY